MCPAEARAILGDEYIIGGTANTYEDVVSLIEKKVDYVGLGPFRFTYTKKKLSPVLGKEGYDQIFFKLKVRNLSIPVVAIGGITDSDIENLMQTKIHGIALAGAIMEGNDIEINIQNYQQLIHSKK